MWFRKRELGAKASRLQNDEAFNKAVEGVRKHYTDALIATKRLDREGRDHLYMAINLLDDVKHHLNLFIEDGKIADAEIKHLKKGE